MQRLVFYGKGGIGKSTISSNISVALSEKGQRVLHVGCDPKHDSTVALMKGEMIPTVVNRDFGPVVTAADIVRTSDTGIDCVEAGGPQAGVGCAGRGISLTLEILDRAALLSTDRYDVVVFDLLGDVVCGGFAAPLRQKVGEKVIIVSSEEVMSLYAANNIARAVVNYASNGIVLAGILLNLRDLEEDLAPVRRFAELLSTHILGVIRRDPLIREAEYQRTTVMEHAPQAPVTALFRQLADTIVGVEPGGCVLPTPLSDRDFHLLAPRKFDPPPGFERAPSLPLGPQPLTSPSLDAQTQLLERSRQEYKRQLKSGIAAVRRGLVDPNEALERLQRSFPELTRTLQLKDLS